MSEIELPEPRAWILGDFNSASVVCSQRHPRATEVYTAEQVRAAILAEREVNALKCDAVSEQAGTEWGTICAAAIRRGSV